MPGRRERGLGTPGAVSARVGCIFVDRDGTLVEDRGYAFRVEDYARLAGAAEGLRLLHAAGWPIAVVTNQSGIGRGYFTEADFRRFQRHLEEDFAAQGVPLAASYFCPHTPEDACSCRKPAPGLLKRAARELGVELGTSWMLGDTPADVETARRAGCRAVYLLTGQGRRHRAELPAGVPVAEDLVAAAQLILASG